MPPDPARCRRGIAILAGLAACASAWADEARAPANAPLQAIVVRAKKVPVVLPDAEVKEHVEAAMHADPYFLDEHVTITVKNGTVILEGIVSDPWDLLHATRIARKIPGVKSVFNNLDLEENGD
jgi:osmotically-inducible protein OsmY